MPVVQTDPRKAQNGPTADLYSVVTFPFLPLLLQNQLKLSHHPQKHYIDAG